MKKVFPYLIYAVAFPLLAIGGAFVFKDKFYAWVTLAAVLLACLPFFIRFEKKETDAKTLILIAVMIALSVVGRFIFAPLPGFKPVTAMTVLTAMYFGSDAGFMTGALTAVISNFYFGQGPWTPFQMFSWGIIGLIAGIFAEKLKKSKGSFRNTLFPAYGYLDSSLGGRIFQLCKIPCGTRFVVAVHRYLRGLERYLFTAPVKTDGQNFAEGKNKIRDMKIFV